jgi:hypothetical protein
LRRLTEPSLSVEGALAWAFVDELPLGGYLVCGLLDGPPVGGGPAGGLPSGRDPEEDLALASGWAPGGSPTWAPLGLRLPHVGPPCSGLGLGGGGATKLASRTDAGRAEVSFMGRAASRKVSGALMWDGRWGCA